MSNDKSRSVKYRHSDQGSFQHTITITSNPESFSTAGANGIIEDIRGSDPEKATKLKALLKTLETNQFRFFDWMEQSPANTKLFLENPLEALKQALPDVSVEV